MWNQFTKKKVSLRNRRENVRAHILVYLWIVLEDVLEMLKSGCGVYRRQENNSTLPFVSTSIALSRAPHKTHLQHLTLP